MEDELTFALTEQQRQQVVKAAMLAAPLFRAHGWCWALGVPGADEIADAYLSLIDRNIKRMGDTASQGRLIVALNENQELEISVSLNTLYVGPEADDEADS
jgi:hypothetical protein